MILFPVALFTAYVATCNGCSGVTASGKVPTPRSHFVAADSRYWRFGDCIEVHHPEPVGWIRYHVEDRGAAVKGPNRFDILMVDVEKAIKFGRQKLEYRTCTT